MQGKESAINSWFYFLFLLYAFVIPVSISAANIALGLIYIVGLSILWRQRGKGGIVFNKGTTVLFIGFFFWGAFCTMLSGNFAIEHILDDMWEYTPIIIFPLLLSIIPINKERVMETLFVSFSIVSILGIIQYFIPAIVYPFPRQLVDDRFRGFNSHPLHTSGIFSIVAIASLSMILFWKCDSMKKRVLWAVFILNSIAVILTMSRSYYISVTVAIFILLLMKNWKWMISGAILLAVLLVMTLSFPNPFNSRIKTLADPNFSSNKERTYMWKSGIEMAKEHPVFGVGKGNWGKEAKERYFPRIEKEYNYKLPDYGHAHNSYITWAGETGLTGLTLALSFWFLVGRSLYSKGSGSEKGTLSYAMAIGTLACLGNLFVAGLFENNLGTAIVLLLISMFAGMFIYEQTPNGLIKEQI